MHPSHCQMVFHYYTSAVVNTDAAMVSRCPFRQSKLLWWFWMPRHQPSPWMGCGVRRWMSTISHTAFICFPTSSLMPRPRRSTTNATVMAVYVIVIFYSGLSTELCSSGYIVALSGEQLPCHLRDRQTHHRMSISCISCSLMKLGGCKIKWQKGSVWEDLQQLAEGHVGLFQCFYSCLYCISFLSGLTHYVPCGFLSCKIRPIFFPGWTS